VYVDDQDKALRFYTDVLGFVKKRDIPLGETRWLTVTSPSGPEGIELLLEPNTRPIARAHQQGLFSAGIPATVLTTDDIKADYERLTQRGVVFTPATIKTGPVTQAIFDDTCGNLIMLTQESLTGTPGRWSGGGVQPRAAFSRAPGPPRPAWPRRSARRFPPAAGRARLPGRSAVS
jgi:catechol 2,3-dioxygenase-like lactoylglutathione lyase family enzyme